MSAYIVENEHINAIVTYALDKQLSFWNPRAKTRTTVTRHNAEEIGRILMDENVRSVGYRYDGEIDDDEKNAGASYSFKRFPTMLTAVEIIKACHCLSYQSCETDDWESTLARRILDAVEGHATHELPGYDAAPWGISPNTMKQLKHAGTISLSSMMKR